MGTPLRVLIVDDSPTAVELLVQQLRDGGYEPIYARVDTAERMSAALEREPWDLILADYAMPQFNGLDALRLWQAHGLDIPFMIVSGAIGVETAVAAMKAGAQDYLMKNDLARLCPAVERELSEAAQRRERKQADGALREAFKWLEQSDAALRACHQQIIQTEKLEAVGQLAAGMTHEIKNPLAILKMGLAYLAGALQNTVAPEVLAVIHDL